MTHETRKPTRHEQTDAIAAEVWRKKLDGTLTEEEWNKAFDEIGRLLGHSPTWLCDDALDPSWVNRRFGGIFD